MRALPEFLAQARANISSTPVAWTDHALVRHARAWNIFDAGLSRLAAEQNVTDPRFLPAAATARDAFLEHATWLDETLRMRPVGRVQLLPAARPSIAT